MIAGISVCVITQSSLSLSDVGLGLAFFVLGVTLLSIPVSFLFLLDTLHIVKRGRSGLWVFRRRLTSPRELTLTLIEWESKAVRNRPSSDL